MSRKSLIGIGSAAAAALALFAAPAHADRASIHLQFNSPGYYAPQPYVYSQPSYVYTQPSYVYTQPSYVYTQPSYVYSPGYVYYGQHGYSGGYRDRDRDGIANRWDRDRDGDGVPNRFDRRPNNPRRY